jgi:hypothetical protein
MESLCLVQCFVSDVQRELMLPRSENKDSAKISLYRKTSLESSAGVTHLVLALWCYP